MLFLFIICVAFIPTSQDLCLILPFSGSFVPLERRGWKGLVVGKLETLNTGGESLESSEAEGL